MVQKKRRIIGQCSTSDFVYLDHLADAMRRGIEPDLTNLTNKQKIAVVVLQHFQKCKVDFSVLLKIKEVLVWEEDGGGMLFEYKLFRPADPQIAGIIRTMRVK